MGRVPRVAAKGFRDQDGTYAKLGAAVAAMHQHGGGHVRQVPDGFEFIPLLPLVTTVPTSTPRLTNDSAGTLLLPDKNGQLTPAPTRLDGHDWCQGCGNLPHRNRMRWSPEGTYRCVTCLGPGVGTSALWCPPDWARVGPEETPLVDWPHWREVGYVLLTAALALVFLASMLGAFS